MKFFKNDKHDSTDNEALIEISLEDAQKEIEELSSSEGYEDAFIGFVSDADETIQFIRNEKNSWRIDVPIIEGDEYAYSLQDFGLTTEVVKDIVKKFPNDDWKSLCNLTRVIEEDNTELEYEDKESIKRKAEIFGDEFEKRLRKVFEEYTDKKKK